MTFVVGEFMALLFYFIFIRGFPRNMRKMDFLSFFFLDMSRRVSIEPCRGPHKRSRWMWFFCVRFSLFVCFVCLFMGWTVYISVPCGPAETIIL